MNNKLLMSIFILSAANSFADCTFTYVNQSQHPLTVQGYFIEGGDPISSNSWVLVASGQTVTQKRIGTNACNSKLTKSNGIATRINLKNNSGYCWVNKDKNVVSRWFSSDKCYSYYTAGSNALSDNHEPITLSDGVAISKTDFKIFICDARVKPEDCNGKLKTTRSVK